MLIQLIYEIQSITVTHSIQNEEDLIENLPPTNMTSALYPMFAIEKSDEKTRSKCLPDDRIRIEFSSPQNSPISDSGAPETVLKIFKLSKQFLVDPDLFSNLKSVKVTTTC